MPAFGQAMTISSLPFVLGAEAEVNLVNFIPIKATPQWMQHDSKVVAEAAACFAATGNPSESPQRVVADETVVSDRIEWLDPREGMKAAAHLQKVLHQPWANDEFPAAVLSMLKKEAKHLKSALLCADIGHFGFYIQLRACDNPPDVVLDWFRAVLTDLGRVLNEAIELASKSNSEPGSQDCANVEGGRVETIEHQTVP
jgi:hypothetical protein